MGMRFYKRMNILPGLSLNFSKGGPSLSIGPRGAKVTLSRRGIRETIGLPGTGISYSTTQSYSKLTKSAAQKKAIQEPEVQQESSEPIRISFLRGVFLPPDEKNFAKAVNLMLEGNIDEALEKFEKLPDIADAAFTAAGLYLNRMEFEKAGQAIDRALANMHRIGELYLRYELFFDLSVPITDICEVILRPDAITAQLIKVEVLQHTGHAREACELLLQLCKQEPDNLIIMISLMELVLETAPRNKRWMNTLVSMSADVTNDTPVQTIVLYYRGVVLKQLGLFDAAQTTLTEAMKRKKDRSKLLILTIMEERAELYELQGKDSSARTMWEKIYAEDPDNAIAKAKLKLN